MKTKVEAELLLRDKETRPRWVRSEIQKRSPRK